jgi:hypothetical protein
MARPCSVPVVKLGRIAPWFKEGRGIAAGAGLFIGFLLAMVLFCKPWHLSPDWGDAPTWVLVFLGTLGGWATLRQLGILQRQVKEEAERFKQEAERNVKRDELMNSQLAEARETARSAKRGQAEGVIVQRTVDRGRLLFAIVENDSSRPITDITCSVMSRTDGTLIAETERCGQFYMTTASKFGPVAPRPGGVEVMVDEGPVSRYGTLPPGKPCKFSFAATDVDEDRIVVAWFTDDAGLRWQLDEFQHLTETKDDAYKR